MARAKKKSLTADILSASPVPRLLAKYPRVSASDIQRKPGALTRAMQNNRPVLVTHYDMPIGIILPVNRSLPNFPLPEIYGALLEGWAGIGKRGTASDFEVEDE